eukprot:1175995-Prorocentrum_minimum.AAC.2
MHTGGVADGGGGQLQSARPWDPALPHAALPRSHGGARAIPAVWEDSLRTRPNSGGGKDTD